MKKTLYGIAFLASAALVHADSVELKGIELFPDDIIKSIRASNKAIAGEMREFRDSAAKIFLDDDSRAMLDKAIEFFERYRNLVRSEDELSRFFDGLVQFSRPMLGADESSEVPFWRYSPPCKLKRGDVVCTRSTAVWADYLAGMSLRDKRFSHIAIVIECDGKIVLAEIKVDVDTAKTKFNEKGWDEVAGDAIDCAVWRFNGEASVRERIARAAEKRIGIPFDPAFDLKTKDRLYCTEMVRDCVNEAAGREVIGTSRKGDFEYVAVDDCYRNEMTKVWDCRDAKPVAESDVKQSEEQMAQKPSHRPVVVEAASTTNAPVRRTNRFVPKNGGGR